ncbi:MAG TPA: DUF5666 domain-containing protein [Candidatus Acidoferrales bacterium]|nr:DUF5666 domain-containing protein [Candidatus Acidoferrales bacterium]
MKKLASLFALLFVFAAPAFSQRPEGGGMRMPAGETVFGKVTAVAKDSVTIAPAAGGDAVTAKVGENTRVFKERQPISLADVKVGDTVFARGPLNGTTLEAAILGVATPEMAERIQQGMGGGKFGGGGKPQFNPEDLGKKFIAGEVKAINETKLTIARPDGQTQEIQVDENTSFRKGRESITLADIHVGDFVRGPGELKENVFFAKELMVGRPQIIAGPAKPGDSK